MICKNCRNNCNANDKFCTRCGQMLEPNFQPIEKPKKNTYTTVIIIIVVVVVLFVSLLLFLVINNNNEDKVFTTLEENINNNCENYTSYIKYSQNNNYWNETYDIGNCDGQFVKNVFSVKKGEEPKYMDKYQYNKTKYKINYDNKINNLFNNILYYNDGVIHSEKIILYGNSVQDIDNYKEQLKQMDVILNENRKQENAFDSGAVQICFTSDRNFTNNDYYKAFLVYDMSYINMYNFKFQVADKINITECTPQIYISGALTHSGIYDETKIDLDYAKENPIKLEK